MTSIGTAEEFTTWGPVRGQGPLRATLEEAEHDLELDRKACSAWTNGYSDRRVARVVDDRLETLDGEPIWPSHGRSCGSVRVER